MLNLGDYVMINHTHLQGYIAKMIKKHPTNHYVINVNDKMIKVKEDDLTLLDHLNEYERIKKNPTFQYQLILNHPDPFLDTIMLRHQTVEEAITHLDQFIDHAICNNIKQIKIIHGKNGGILRKSVHEYLLQHPSVKEHRLGGYYEGSYGVTIAFLK